MGRPSAVPCSESHGGFPLMGPVVGVPWRMSPVGIQLVGAPTGGPLGPVVVRWRRSHGGVPKRESNGFVLETGPLEGFPWVRSHEGSN
jgi:hypothetical protein